MGTRFVFTCDLRGADIGMLGAGLLYQKGQVVENLLPEIEKLLLLQGKIVPESELQQQQQAGKAKSRFAIKRGRGAPENKAG